MQQEVPFCDAVGSSHGHLAAGTVEQGGSSKMVKVFVKAYGQFSKRDAKRLEYFMMAFFPDIIEADVIVACLKACITMGGEFSASDFAAKIRDLVASIMVETAASVVDVQLRDGLCLHFMRGVSSIT
jgi:hypothetical protein